jgi:hypothetical protein
VRNRRSKVGPITGEPGKWTEGERVADAALHNPAISSPVYVTPPFSGAFESPFTAGNVTMAAGLRSTAKAVGRPPEPTVRAPVLDPTDGVHGPAAGVRHNQT